MCVYLYITSEIVKRKERICAFTKTNMAVFNF